MDPLTGRLWLEAGLAFARTVLPLAMRYGGSCINWGRTDRKNASLRPHSVPNSLHRAWCAMDIEFDTQDGKKLFADHAERLGLEVVVKTNAVHVEMDLKSWLTNHPDTDGGITA